MTRTIDRDIVIRDRADGDVALQGVATMQKGRVVNMDAQIATAAALVSTEHTLPMADSIILATAKAHDAKL